MLLGVFRRFRFVSRGGLGVACARAPIILAALVSSFWGDAREP
ncbi:hypothetical protein FHR84_000655 [Actinopolyspora biskrensis]|uniref:Uncharacterized protein n=1 Tax=Actinopolyspora biskrensis TaxID=1470178 RepID=A0A852YRI0_9ACTN|nr:hypothetical protein [Actinopolyspora biskrensis]NYH77341.1 hypothetical protein [Actinopolyspora biskrensis]